MAKSIKLENDILLDGSSVVINRQKLPNALDGKLNSPMYNRFVAGGSDKGNYYEIASSTVGKYADVSLTFIATAQGNSIGAGLYMVNCYGAGTNTGSYQRHNFYVVGFNEFNNSEPMQLYYDDDGKLHLYFTNIDYWYGCIFTVLSYTGGWEFKQNITAVSSPSGTKVNITKK